MDHQTSMVLKTIYPSTQVLTPPITEFPLLDSGLSILVFSQGYDTTACLNKAMAFLIVVAASRFPSTNNQLKTSSNLRNQATIQDDKVTVQQVQGRQGHFMLVLAIKESGQILDEEQHTCLADTEILDGQAAQIIIPTNVAFQSEDLNAYDSDCDDVSNAKVVLIANLSNLFLTLSQRYPILKPIIMIWIIKICM
ncbi:hypothetical protein Tco_0770905 [Tanacetum coccineum]|uniref:Uncharacterized protein n=1 Tax=Tanacetum coccineum TaxID=301880 RepID=A0ABQ4ZDJ4_9ASTR